MAFRNLYALFGVTRDVTDGELRARYKALVLELHPDRNPSPDAERKLKDINAAYAILKEPESRARYDAFASMSPSEQVAYARRYTEVRREEARRPMRTVQQIFDEMHAMDDEGQMYIRCGVCSSTGFVYQYFWAPCGRCDGKGYVLDAPA